ncbi:chromosome replication/partitioning protein [Borrelia persica]|uniref:chromosome replication/partitioning protein n=1 Tax=Borrelia persica TaxID=44448 RepID=UPI000467DEEA|nr:chromosome replication/partitioning protein [Borrelia persica]
MSQYVVVLNDREEGLMDISEEEEYENCKHSLRKSMVNDIENKIQIMEILYNVRKKKLYRFDHHATFDAFIKAFGIGKTQAYLYLKIYEQILKGTLTVKEIREKGLIEIYRNIKLKEISAKKSRQNLIKPLRFQLKDHKSYDFYKKRSKFAAFILDKLFLEDKTYLDKLFKEYSGSDCN